MSIAGILSSRLFNSNHQALTNSQPSFQKEFQQLGEDLQSGNLSAAPGDFATLQQKSPGANATMPASTGNSIALAFSQLGKDLQSGNLPGARQDFSNIQQGLQGPGAQAHHRHRHSGGREVTSLGQQSALAQEFVQLGHDLQTRNVAAAQQAYSAVQQSFLALPASTALAPLQVTA